MNSVEKQLLLSWSSHIARRSILREYPKACLCSFLDEIYARSHISLYPLTDLTFSVHVVTIVTRILHLEFLLLLANDIMAR